MLTSAFYLFRGFPFSRQGKSHFKKPHASPVVNCYSSNLVASDEQGASLLLHTPYILVWKLAVAKVAHGSPHAMSHDPLNFPIKSAHHFMTHSISKSMDHSYVSVFVCVSA